MFLLFFYSSYIGCFVCFGFKNIFQLYQIVKVWKSLSCKSPLFMNMERCALKNSVLIDYKKCLMTSSPSNNRNSSQTLFEVEQWNIFNCKPAKYVQYTQPDCVWSLIISVLAWQRLGYYGLMEDIVYWCKYLRGSTTAYIQLVICQNLRKSQGT